MAEYSRPLLLAFFPLSGAIDTIGTMPVLPHFFKANPFRQRVSVTDIDLVTAFGVGALFLLLGHVLLRFLGIRVEHFAIAGGLILLTIAVQEIISDKPANLPDQTELLAVVPIGPRLRHVSTGAASAVPWREETPAAGHRGLFCCCGPDSGYLGAGGATSSTVTLVILSPLTSFRTTSMPSITLPNTECLRSRWGCGS